MSSRIGICQQCGQRFGDIPDTLTATKVKCPDCGGVVDIPPAAESAQPPPAEVPAREASATAAPEPAKPAPPAASSGPVARPLGDAKKKERPSEARSVDRGVATPAPKPAAAKPVVPPKPVAKKAVVPPKPVAKKPVVPPKPVAKKPVVPPKPVAKNPVVPPKPVAKKPEAPSSKPAAAASAGRKPSAADILAKAKAKRAAESSAASTERKPTAAEILAKAKAKRAAESAGKATAAAAATQGRPSGKGPVRRTPGGPPAAGGGRRRPPAGAAPSGGGARSRRREREEEVEYEESGPNGVQIASGVVLVLVLAGGAWWMFGPKGDATPADNTVVAPGPSASGTANASPGIDPNAGGSTAAGASDAASGGGDTDAGTTPESGTGDGGAASDAGGEASDPAPTAPKPAPSSGSPGIWKTPEDPMASVEWRNFEDPSAMLLGEVPALPRHPATSDEIWAEVQEDLALFIADSGVMSTRAGDRLLEDHGRDAFPAIINAAMAVDWEGEGGTRAAGMLVNLLDRKWVKSGSRFGWTEPALYEKGSDDWKEAMVTAKSVVLRWRNYWVQTLGVTESGWQDFSGEKVSGASGGDGGGVVAPPDPFD